MRLISKCLNWMSGGFVIPTLNCKAKFILGGIFFIAGLHSEIAAQSVTNKKLVSAIDLFFTENRNEELLSLLAKLPDSEVSIEEIQLKNIMIAAGLCELGKVDSASVMISQADNIRVNSSPFLLFWRRSVLGLILFRKDELSKAYEVLCQPEQYSYDESAVGLRMRIMGRIALAMNDYKQCLDWLMQSSQHFKKASRTKSIAINEKIVGRCYMLIGNYPSAIEHFNKAEAMLLSCNDELELFYVYINILDYYLKQRNITESKKYVNLSQIIGNKFNDVNLKVLVSNNLGQIALLEGRSEDAIENFHSTLSFCRLTKAVRSEIVANIGMSSAMMQLHKLEDALGYGKQAMKLATNSRQKLLCQMACQNMAECYQNTDKNLAFIYLDKAVKYDDSIKRASIDVYSAFCQAKVELDNSVHSLAQVNEVAKERFYAFLGLLGFLMIMLLLLGKFYFSNYVQSLDRIKQLQQEDLAEFTPKLDRSVNEVGIKLSEEKIAILIKELKHLMEKERIYRDPELSLNSVAEKLNTNREYLSQVINNVIGKNFIEYINSYRIEEAKKMLAEQITKRTRILNIAAIANLVGFKNTSTFNPIFKRATGFTPSEYKKALENTSELVNSENIIL